MSVIAAIRMMREFGLSEKQALACAEAFESPKTARQERNARYYEKRKRLKTSGIKTSEKASESVLIEKGSDGSNDNITLTSLTSKDLSSLRSDNKRNPLEILKLVLSEQTAKDVIAHRKAKRAPLTPRAAELLAAAFRDHGNPEAAAAAMIVNGWQGFRPEWLNGDGSLPPLQRGVTPGGRSNGTRGFLENVARMMANGTNSGTTSGNGSSHETVLGLPERRG